MTKGMLMYYSTVMLWSRLLDMKAKRGNTTFSFHELKYCKAVMQHKYDIPLPIYLFLKGIGEVKDEIGPPLVTNFITFGVLALFTHFVVYFL